MLDEKMAKLFLGFVFERHRVWEARQIGEPGPWTSDPILRGRKFTNVYRVLDHGSQFLLKELVHGQPRDVLMRCFLYRHTNLPEPWQYAELILGTYPTVNRLDDLLETWKYYRGRSTPNGGSRKGRSLFSGAYMVFPQSQVPGTDKIESVIDLTKRLFTPGSPDDIVPDFMSASSQAERFGVLRRNKGVADFMSMQILTDWGYSPHASGGHLLEDEFVVPGPGAIKGARYLDPERAPRATLEWAVSAIREDLRCPYLLTPSGRDRAPSYMDAQNCLCEFSKYIRWLQRPAPERAYEPAHPGRQPYPMLPEHW